MTTDKIDYWAYRRIKGAIDVLEDPEHLPRTLTAYKAFLMRELEYVKEEEQLREKVAKSPP